MSPPHPEGPAPATQGPPLLEARGLVRAYGPTRAVDGVDVVLPPGAFLTVFGPNGAGKTTLLRLLSGSLKPTSGEVRIGGAPLRARRPEWRARIGVLSHQTFLYGNLTARENLLFYGRLYGLSGLEDRISERLARVGLLERDFHRVATFSRGMRQRLALARTLLHDPDVVLLDEPYTGLDAHAAALLREVLAGLKDGMRSVVLVTHNLSEGLEAADVVTVMVRGRFALEARRDALDPGEFPRLYLETVDRAEAGGATGRRP